MRSVDKELLILLLLKSIELSKALFVMEIEQGNETIIPKEWSQDTFPMCMRYYDPILKIIFLN